MTDQQLPLEGPHLPAKQMEVREMLSYFSHLDVDLRFLMAGIGACREQV
jgi:hypothetical protein